MNIMEAINKSQKKKGIPAFRPGDVVRVHARITEGEKQRIQVFEGVVIKRKGGDIQETFTVRKVSYGVGVERIFPVHSPMIDKIEVKSRGKVRRAKLYYLRDLSGRSARIAGDRQEYGTAAAALAVETVAPAAVEMASETPEAKK